MRNVLFKMCIVFSLFISGCIVSFSPRDNIVVVSPGETTKFSVTVNPAPSEYKWYLNGEEVPGASGNSYNYTPGENALNMCELKVIAGKDTHIWTLKVKTTWSRMWGKKDNEVITISSIMADGSIVVAGTTDSSDIYMAKFNKIGQKQWEKTIYAECGRPVAESIVQLNDESILLLISRHYPDKPSLICNIKLDGKLNWKESMTTGNSSWLKKIKKLNDGSLIGIVSYEGNAGLTDYIAFFNSLGKLVNFKNIITGGNSFERINDIEQTNDGGYIGVGYSTSANLNEFNKDHTDHPDDKEFYIIRLNKDFNILWQRVWGGIPLRDDDGQDELFAVKRALNNQYVAVGGSTSVWIPKLKLDHSVIFNDYNNVFKSSPDPYFLQIKENGYSDYSCTFSGFVDEDDTYGFIDDNPISLRVTSNGEVIVAASTKSTDAYQIENFQGCGDIIEEIEKGINRSNVVNHGDNDFYIVKLDSNFKMIWQKMYGGNKDDILTSLILTPKDEIILAGSSMSSDFSVDIPYPINNGGSDYFLMKLDGNGNY